VIITYFDADKNSKQSIVITSPTEGDGGCFRLYRHVYVCVCYFLSPIVTKRRQSYPWPQGMRWLNFGRSKAKVGAGGMHYTEPF